MTRIFAVDILECGRCQGQMRILGVIEQPEVIAKILTHLGLSARAPPPSPLRPDLGTRRHHLSLIPSPADAIPL